ncbi:MAG: STAS domain-containing protein [Thermoguttaceae bacterium]|jgi:anti-anti-sigma factor|nr:STAS domain-containing protein [Thermoguttaceae bacterium]
MFDHTRQGAVDVITGDDPINVDHVDRVLTLLQSCGSHGQPRVVLDLDRVPLIDSAGLEMLLDVQEEYQRRGGTLKLAVRNSLCREILSVTGVGRHFEIYPEAASAVGSFVQ